MSIAESLSAFQFAALEWNAFKPMSHDLAARHLVDLRRAVESMERAAGPAVPRASAGLDEARGRWRDAGDDLAFLSHREMRILCADVETACQPRFITALKRSTEVNQKATWLAGLVHAYAHRWGELPDNSLERLLNGAIKGYQGRNPWILTLRPHADAVFSPASASWVAGQAVRERVAVNVVLDRLGLPLVSALASRALDDLGERWRALFNANGARMPEPEALSWLEYLVKDVFGRDPRPTAYRALEAAICSSWPESSGDYKRVLQAFVLRSDRLGDPRLHAHGPNWARLSADARNRVLGWLAQESVRFFFQTILPNRPENRARGEFWLRYYRRIVDFRVAVSAHDEIKLQARPSATVPQYSRTDHESTSAFIMRLQGQSGHDRVVVEFSETGHAAYIYEAAKFYKRVGTLHQGKFGLKQDLKGADRIGRIIHRDPWHGRAANLLAQMGIRP